ncbi:uncharacterized protein BP5553_00301 [Venustampulla echinocandica]|uniref:Uncharacterized protein n=1 Tax=Venustampulla echinocandica TaxID=2656787 RepID=A0A370TXR5_9HELO|nr:uncharacterized protein BP5553_00301 [Venustampulla echinocandica]RDL40322.1 hypothetical protein BP5553_00301 [Venustampulla echinocandica]
MSRASNTGNLMDTEPGGEQTQYEGTSTFMKPHEKSRGSFGDWDIFPVAVGGCFNSDFPRVIETSSATEDFQKAEDKNNAANGGGDGGERMMGGEQGYAGQTVGNQGEAAKGAGYGKVEDRGEGKTEGAAKTRREQGYGPGSGVGA